MTTDFWIEEWKILCVHVYARSPRLSPPSTQQDKITFLFEYSMFTLLWLYVSKLHHVVDSAYMQLFSLGLINCLLSIFSFSIPMTLIHPRTLWQNYKSPSCSNTSFPAPFCTVCFLGSHRASYIICYLLPLSPGFSLSLFSLLLEKQILESLSDKRGVKGTFFETL